MASFFSLLKIGSFVIAFFGVFLPMYSDSLVNPDIEITVPNSKQVKDQTMAQLLIKNVGFEPATNLRITINPEHVIHNFTAIFYTEEIELHKNGDKSIIGKMTRLANDQRIIITTFINSTNLSNFAIYVTHDQGSTSYFYNKSSSGQLDLKLMLSIFIGIIAAAAAGISTSTIVKRYETKIQQTGDGGVNLQGDISNSRVVIHAGIPQPLTPTSPPDESVMRPEPKGALPKGFEQSSKHVKPEGFSFTPTPDDPIRNLLKRITKENISNLLQEAKLIAIDTNDEEMQSWIDLELNGFVPPKGKQLTRKEAKEQGLLPDYRDIKGKYLIKFGDGSLNEYDYPILFGNDIKKVESSIDTINRGGHVFIKHTFSKSLPVIGGKTGDLELPRPELERIIHGAEQKLSQYLESKIY